VGGAVALTAGVQISQTLASDFIGVKHVHSEQRIYDYDLAGTSTRANRGLFPTR